MRLALFQPDIPQNTGTMLRLARCFGIGVDIIEPCGFLLDDRRLRRAGMDYVDGVDLRRHPSWEDYRQGGCPGRLVLLTTRGEVVYADFAFAWGDTLMVGQESAGVPGCVHAAADARLRVPMAPGTRSLNVAVTAGIVLAEALRQTGRFPGEAR